MNQQIITIVAPYHDAVHIQIAANLCGMNINDFILRVVLKKCDHIIKAYTDKSEELGEYAATNANEMIDGKHS